MITAAKLRTVDAIRDVKNGASLRGPCRTHDVNRAYVRRRLQGVMTRNEYNSTLQRVPKQQEASLSHWIIVQGNLGYAPPHSRFRAFAQRLLINSGSTERLGAKWVSRFLERHPEIRTIKGVAIDYKGLGPDFETGINFIASLLWDGPRFRNMLH